MGNLSKNFDTKEFRCKDGCGFGELIEDYSPDLINDLQKLRDIIGKPIHIVSGCRCKKYNKQCGGVMSSQHLNGTAADIMVDSLTPVEVRELVLTHCEHFINGGVGLYETFVHVDVRRHKARWVG